MHTQEGISLALDVILVVAGIAAFMARPRIGGELARGLRVLLAGIIVLGFAHLAETASLALLGFNIEVNEIAHRLLVGVAFVLIIAGFMIMRRAFEG